MPRWRGPGSPSARDCGFDDIAKRSVSAAVSAAEMLRDTKGSDTWDLGHALLWAGLAARSVGDEHGIARLREIFENMLAAEHRTPFRNQELQAASVLGTHTLLQEVAKDSARYPQSPVRDGNLALALATAGLTGELRNRFDEVDKAGGDPRGEDETRKHYAWALALDGRVEQALECLKRIHDKEEQARALRHVSRVLVQRGNEALLPDVRELATRLARSSELKVKVLAASVFDILGDRGRALALAEEVIALGFMPSESTCVAFRKEGSARRPISTEIQELSDQQTT